MLFSGAFYLFEVATDNFTVSFYSLKSQQKKTKKKKIESFAPWTP